MAVTEMAIPRISEKKFLKLQKRMAKYGIYTHAITDDFGATYISISNSKKELQRYEAAR